MTGLRPGIGQARVQWVRRAGCVRWAAPTTRITPRVDLMTADYDRNRGASAATDTSFANEQRGNGPADDSSFAHLRDNIIEALRILALRRWTFFIPFCLVTCAVAVGSHWITRTYRSSTIIERRDHPVLMNLRQTAATGEFSRFFRPTLVQDVKSIETMTEVVEELELVEDIERDAGGALTPEAQKALRRKAASLIGGVDARVVQRADHYDEISISYEGSEPYLPRRLVDQLKNVYVRRMRATLIDMLTEGMAYFQGQADDRRAEVDLLEEDILRFEAQYLGVDPTNPGALKLKLTSLEAEQQELTRDIASLQSEVAARQHLLDVYAQRAAARQAELRRLANEGIAINDPAVPKSAASQALEQEIRNLQSEIHNLQLTRRMTDLHPDVVERRNRITRLRESLKEQYLADAATANRPAGLSESGADAAVEQAVGLDMELIKLRMELQDREGRLASAESRLRTVGSDIDRHRELQQNVFHFRHDYQIKSEALAQARKDLALNRYRVNEIASILNADESQRGVSFNVRTPPSGGMTPVRPKGAMILVCALLAGIALGAVAVLIQEVFDQTYHTARQITRSLGIAILETVDEIVTSADRARLFRRRVIYAPAAVTVLLATVGLCCAAAYLSVEDPRAYQRAMNGPRYFMNRIQGGASMAVTPIGDQPQSQDEADRTTEPVERLITGPAEPALDDEDFIPVAVLDDIH
jgi:hypothetical protein